MPSSYWEDCEDPSPCLGSKEFQIGQLNVLAIERSCRLYGSFQFAVSPLQGHNFNRPRQASKKFFTAVLSGSLAFSWRGMLGSRDAAVGVCSNESHS
jgi:hypothetical protein